MLRREHVDGAPGWRPEATRLPPGTIRAPIMGFDLVRNEFGGWRVLEDNVRNPSGAAYAIAIRDLMDEVLPDLPRPEGLLDPADALPRMRDACWRTPGRTAPPRCCRRAQQRPPGSSTGCWPNGAAWCSSSPTT